MDQINNYKKYIYICSGTFIFIYFKLCDNNGNDIKYKSAKSRDVEWPWGALSAFSVADVQTTSGFQCLHLGGYFKRSTSSVQENSIGIVTKIIAPLAFGLNPATV